MADTIRLWFEATTALFEVFLEAKFELYGDVAIRTRGMEASSAVITDGHLRSRPTSFVDAAERLVFDAMDGLPSGFGTETADEVAAAATLYGELTTAGIRQFVSIVAEASTADASAVAVRGVVVWDLGSGTGRVTLESYLALRSLMPSFVPVAAVGVEFCKGRHDVAVVAAGRLRSALGPGAPPVPVALKHGDFFDASVPFVDRGASAVDVMDSAALDERLSRPFVAAFCCGVGFSVEQCNAICDRLAAVGDRLMCAVLLFKTVPTDNALLRDGSVWRRQSVTIGATWMDEAPAVAVLWRRGDGAA